MTRTTYITKLEEIKGLKFCCEKCGSNWYVPMKGILPPDRCIGCGEPIPGSKIAAVMEKINDLQILSNSSKFKVLIETDFDK